MSQMRTVHSEELAISALPEMDLERIRTNGTDDFGNLLVPRVDEAGGSPLRCCLEESRPGELIVLLAYRPFPSAGPYAEVGPVFCHATACGGYTTPRQYPKAFAHRRQLLRAYDHDQRICEGIQAKDGEQALQLLTWMLSSGDVAFVHSRNVEWGCYMFSATRAP
jgi:Protein of unknown function (DUF1203)